MVPRESYWTQSRGTATVLCHLLWVAREATGPAGPLGHRTIPFREQDHLSAELRPMGRLTLESERMEFGRGCPMFT